MPIFAFFNQDLSLSEEDLSLSEMLASFWVLFCELQLMVFDCVVRTFSYS